MPLSRTRERLVKIAGLALDEFLPFVRFNWGSLVWNERSPVGKVVVERLRGNKERRRFPPNAQGIIRRNPMGSIRIIEFDIAGSVMDSAYIGATLGGDSPISVVSYSRRTKKDYGITKLTKDTKIVGNRDYYAKNRAKP